MVNSQFLPLLSENFTSKVIILIEDFLTAEDSEQRRGMNIYDISGAIVESAMKLHTGLGPGLLDHAYQAFLRHELSKE